MDSAAHHPAQGGGEVLFPLLVALLAYLFGARSWNRQGDKGGKWSRWRTAAFAGGIALLALALLPPVAGWAHGSLQGHMVQHLLLGMLAPLGLVLGAPGMLLLRTLPARAGRRIMAFLAARPIRLLIHPFTALLLDIGGMYLLYLTPLYALALANGTVHAWMHLHFVVSGYLFTWAIAGPDPAPHRPGLGIRLAALFLATAAHASLGKFMYAYGFPRGTPHDPGEIQVAAQLMYYGGDLAELLLAVAFFAACPMRAADWVQGPRVRRLRPRGGVAGR